MSVMTVNKLQRRYEEKCKNRIKVFEKIYNKCDYLIQISAENRKNYCLFSIPQFMLGEPTYSLPHCAAYLVFNLRENGFTAEFHNPNVVLIKWQYDNYFTDGGNVPAITYDKSQLTINNKKKEISINTDTYYRSKQKAKPELTFRKIHDYTPSGKFLFN